jgi:uncharacterized protein (TIGR03790 family)
MFKKNLLLQLALLSLVIVLASCAAKMKPHVSKLPPATNVLLVINDNSPESQQVGSYYAEMRNVPERNVLHIKTGTGEEIGRSDFDQQVGKPVKDYLASSGLNKTVDYLVLTIGEPIRIEDGLSVDGQLMCMDLDLKQVNGQHPYPNPYFNKKDHFSHAKFKMYLATRLIGYTVDDAKALVDHSLEAKPENGLFLINTAANRTSGDYGNMNMAMTRASALIAKKGFDSHLDSSGKFAGGYEGLMGYFSWGSNDGAFDLNAYKSNRFLPGAIAETAVSTGARTFKHTTEGQSLIADLIASGVTGVKGYVSEPYLFAIADPIILFDRYLSGYNLAESFYAASRVIYWKDMVVGDPLCSPYAEKAVSH